MIASILNARSTALLRQGPINSISRHSVVFRWHTRSCEELHLDWTCFSPISDIFSDDLLCISPSQQSR